MQPRLDFDPCANRHGGNVQSVEAFARVSAHDELHALTLIVSAGDEGLTSAEIEWLWKPKNKFSGRLTALLAKGMIEKVGVRLGCGIYKATPLGREGLEARNG